MLTFNPQDPFSCFVTQSLSMKSAVENAQRFAMFDVPLLIQGETGTGKDLLAKACHFASLRREKKFIAVNCAGLPDEDAESEMFGRKVGDSETIGFFEYANEGTVLLDGIAELSLSLQEIIAFFNRWFFPSSGGRKRTSCKCSGELYFTRTDGKAVRTREIAQ